MHKRRLILIKSRVERFKLFLHVTVLFYSGILIDDYNDEFVVYNFRIWT